MTSQSTINFLRHLAGNPATTKSKPTSGNCWSRNLAPNFGSRFRAPRARSARPSRRADRPHRLRSQTRSRLEVDRRRAQDAGLPRQSRGRTGEPFVGIASDGRKWIVFALEQGALGQDQGDNPRSREARRVSRLARRRAGAEDVAAARPADGADRTRRRVGRVPCGGAGACARFGGG